MTDESRSPEDSEKRYRVTFQKISQLLAHRWPEYVIEIIVVIIGITISLALSNWQENVSDSRLEQVYLKDLLEDISSDIDELEKTIGDTDSVIQSGNTLLKQSDAEKITLEKREFVNLMRSIIKRPNFISKNATFSALKSSANFQLIKDIELKKLLFEYDQQYQGLKSVEQAELQETVVITGPYIIKCIPFADSKQSDYWLKTLDIGNILSDIEFVNNIVLRRGKRTELLESYNEILKIAYQIREALQRSVKH